MPVIESAVDPASEQYGTNRAALLALLAAHDEQLALVRAGGGERYQTRHHARGRLLARERIELLLDRGQRLPRALAPGRVGDRIQVGASIVTGIGVVSGVECVLIAH